MDPTKLVFDFNPAAQYPPAPSGLGGQVDLAKPNNFPSIIGTGVTAAVGFINPYGLNTPHIHPRTTEFLVLAQGSNVQTGFILENGFSHSTEHDPLSIPRHRFSRGRYSLPIQR
jgi:hypothetical protein